MSYVDSSRFILAGHRFRPTDEHKKDAKNLAMASNLVQFAYAPFVYVLVWCYVLIGR